jgi:hypothetical protein
MEDRISSQPRCAIAGTHKDGEWRKRSITYQLARCELPETVDDLGGRGERDIDENDRPANGLTGGEGRDERA